MKLPLASLLIAPACLAQSTWIVDSLNRPGTNFTDLPAAFAAAQNGDTFLVRYQTASGPYYKGATLSVGATVLAEPGVKAEGDLVVSAIPASQRAVVKGFVMLTDAASSRGSVRVRDCAGPVVLEAMTAISTHVGAALEVSRSTSVSVNGSTFQAAFFTPLSGGHAVECTSSTLAFTDSIAQGLANSLLGSFTGLSVQSSRVVIANGSITGVNGVCNLSHTLCVPLTSCLPAIKATSSVIAIGVGATITGGVPLGCACNLVPAQGVLADTASLVYLDVASTVTVGGVVPIVTPIASLRAAGTAPGQTLSLTLASSVAAPFRYLPEPAGRAAARRSARDLARSRDAADRGRGLGHGLAHDHAARARVLAARPAARVPERAARRRRGEHLGAGGGRLVLGARGETRC